MNNRPMRIQALALAAALALAITAAAYFAAANGWHRTFEQIRLLREEHGIAASAAAFFCANAILCAAGVPRLWTSAAAGALFGGWGGLALSLPSSVAGSWILFELARALGQAKFEKLFGAGANGKAARFSRMFNADMGAIEIALARQIPLHGSVLTLALSLTRTSRAAFVFGSTLGFLPGALAASFAGDIATARQSMADMALSCVLIAASILFVRRLRRRTAIKTLH
jgi:Uncharacterized conserved protein